MYLVDKTSFRMSTVAWAAVLSFSTHNNGEQGAVQCQKSKKF